MPGFNSTLRLGGMGGQCGRLLPRVVGLALVLLFAAAIASCAPAGPPPTPPTAIGSGFKLVFAEEFDGDRLDSARWASGMPWGDVTTGNAEGYRESALALGSGILSMVATKRQAGDKSYTSGAINSSGRYEFTYGYAEARVRIPRGRGLWPAFWLLSTGSGPTGEIDVLEVLGQDPGRNHMTLHLESGPSKSETGESWAGPDLSAAYHTYGVDWEPGYTVWYVDGIERFRSKSNVPARPMCLIANLAVGGPTSWPGPPDVQTAFPATMQVDYIRVYQRR
jgi:beta-glucanase (GH16 family)